MRLSVCNFPLSLSLSLSVSMEARRISLEQRWLFAIVATMILDSERKRGRFEAVEIELYESYGPLIAMRRCHRRPLR